MSYIRLFYTSRRKCIFDNNFVFLSHIQTNLDYNIRIVYDILFADFMLDILSAKTLNVFIRRDEP